MKRLLQVLIMAALLVTNIGVVSAHEGHEGAHPVGTNVASGGTVYFVSPDGTLRPYTSAGAFLSYGFNSWATVQPASSADLALPRGEFVPPQDGKIVCDNKVRIGTCYLITEGWKIGFVTEADFKNLGFSFSRALWGDVWFLGEKQNIANGYEAHRPGVLVKDGGTVYYVSPQGLAGFPSIDIFLSWGYSFGDVVPANAADKALPKFGLVGARQPGQLSPKLGLEVAPSEFIQVTSPTGGEVWPLGSTQTIRWHSNSYGSRIDIYLNEYFYCDLSRPCPARLYRTYILAEKFLNTNEFTWQIGASIPPGPYKIVVSSSYNKEAYDESDYPFDITAKETSASMRDGQRLADVRQIASALELYFNDNNMYPDYLYKLVPNYIGTLPVAATPADGACSEYQNVYAYSRISTTRYNLTFCLGATTGGYSAGPHTLSEAGIK